MTYLNWVVGDQVGIGVNVAEFCGITNFIFIDSYDIEKYPTALNIICPIDGCNTKRCLDTSGRQVNFFSCKNYHSTLNDVNCNNLSYDKYYRQIGSVSTDANGNATFTHVVTSQDLADYNDAISLGGIYNIIACISDSLATNAHAVNFGNITIVIPTATNYIEWDFSALESSFLSFIASSIASLSTWLAANIPTPKNIMYSYSTYDSNTGKFRIYVDYTAPAFAGMNAGMNHGSMNHASMNAGGMSIGMDTGDISILYDPDIRKLYDKYNIQYLNPSIWDWITSGINLTLDIYARAISTIILFMIAGQFGLEFGLGVGIVAIILAAIISWYIIGDVLTGGKTTGSTGPTTPNQNIDTVNCFVHGYLIPQCNRNYPGCAIPNIIPSDCPTPTPTPTPTIAPTPSPCATCTVSCQHDMMICVGNTRVAQITYNNGQTGTTITDPNAVNNALIDCITKLENGTYTIQQAQDCFNTNVSIPTDQNTSNSLNLTNCSACGPTCVYDKVQQKCIQTCAVPIFGWCADTALAVGGLIVVGYVALKVTKVL